MDFSGTNIFNYFFMHILRTKINVDYKKIKTTINVDYFLRIFSKDKNISKTEGPKEGPHQRVFFLIF